MSDFEEPPDYVEYNKVLSLIVKLGNYNKDVSAAAEAELEKLGAAAVPVLIDNVKNLGVIPDIRKRAALLLGKIGDERAIPVLVDALGDVLTELQNNAEKALVMFGRKAVPPLLETLENRSYYTGVRCAQLIAEIIGQDKTISILRALARAKPLDRGKYTQIIKMAYKPGRNPEMNGGSKKPESGIEDLGLKQSLMRQMKPKSAPIPQTKEKKLVA